MQIGTAVSSNLGLFLGGGVQISNVARLTVGRTWQRMPELIDQEPGDAVGSKDDIRTRDHFVGATYFALVFALDSLPVFKKD